MGAVFGTEVPSFEVRYARNDEETRVALLVEDDVFREMAFLPVGQLYMPFLPQSTVIGAFTADGSCLGVMRLIDGHPHVPPFLEPDHHVTITQQREKWLDLAHQGLLGEVATIAVPQRYRGSPVLLDLIRFGFRHTRGFNLDLDPYAEHKTHLAAILAPAVAWGLRLRYYFPFQQIGPEQHYMEGTEYREDIVTAPYMLDLDRFEYESLTSRPEFKEWMIHAPMTDHVPPDIPHLHRDSPLLVGCMLPSMSETN